MQMHASNRLVIVWLSLLALTLLTGLAANALSAISAILVVPILALASLIKARLILSHYLGLRQAPDWNKAFLAILVVLVLIVYALELIAYRQ